MVVELSEELAALVRRKVESGRYTSDLEVVEAALHALEEQDQFGEMDFEELRRKIAVGLEQLNRGEYVMLSEEVE